MENILRNKQNYITNGKMSEVIIEGNVFSGFSSYTFVWEKSYKETPQRADDGRIGNLNSYPTFVVPHAKITYDIMPIDLYRTYKDLVNSTNEVTITIYDAENDRTTTQRMYFGTDEMPDFYTDVITNTDGTTSVCLLGVKNFTIDMIGTKGDVDTLSVIYNLNAPNSSGENIGSFETQDGGDFIVGYGVDYDYENESFDGQYDFIGWNTKADGSGTTYVDGTVRTLSKAMLNADNEDGERRNLVLYAQWKAVSTYTLTYAYGLGTPLYDSKNNEIVSKTIQYGERYGTLPNSLSLPTVMYDNQTYYPYKNPAWYKTPVKGSNSVALSADSIYEVRGNSTIYQLYDTNTYTVRFDSQGGTQFETLNAVPYGSTIALPKPAKQGYTFGGWKLDNKAFNGIMPPFNITLTAEWSAE